MEISDEVQENPKENLTTEVEIIGIFKTIFFFLY